MQIGIVHYHLNRGGVTRILASTLAALAGMESSLERVVIFYGGRREAWPVDNPVPDSPFAVQLVPVAELEYDALRESPHVVAMAAALEQAIANSGLEPPAILHVHNHSLGKNAALPAAIERLAERGYPVLLQIHDFAEDLRPENYAHLREALGLNSTADVAEAIYPIHPAIHYATLTSRDGAILKRAGIPADRLHLLPNPVANSDLVTSQQEARGRMQDLGLFPAGDTPVWLYPVRGIRRKNVGEMLLWPLLAEEVCTAITLGPLNPLERRRYDAWRSVAGESGLACRFGVGEYNGVSFEDLVAASQAILTCSVAEGFGMVFLEAAMLGRPLIGRDLPDITIDFKDLSRGEDALNLPAISGQRSTGGVTFAGLFQELRIPGELIDRGKVLELLIELFRSVAESYQWDDPRAEETFKSWLAADCLDFARLPWEHQAAVVQKARSNPRELEKIRDANPQLEEITRFARAEDQNDGASNCRIIEDEFGLEAFGKRLGTVYAKMLDGTYSSVEGERIDGAALLQEFLTPERFYALRVEA